MGNLKQVKLKADRLKEGINLLKQLKDSGINDFSFGYIEMKEKISEWVKSDESWEGQIHFRDYGRVAEVDLPKYNNRSASINLKCKKI